MCKIEVIIHKKCSNHFWLPTRTQRGSSAEHLILEIKQNMLKERIQPDIFKRKETRSAEKVCQDFVICKIIIIVMAMYPILYIIKHLEMHFISGSSKHPIKLYQFTDEDTEVQRY